MNDSQSAFNFLRRLHYYKSCSYQVHKSCCYRLFNFQEFKQNDLRTSCSSSNYCTNFREKQIKKKEKKSICVKPWLKRRKNLRFYKTLLAELLLEEEYNYNILLRMTSENSEEIFQQIKREIPKEKTNPVQFITCSRNWLFINNGSYTRVMVMSIILPNQL